MWNVDPADPLHPASVDELSFDLSPRAIMNLLFFEFEDGLVVAAATDDGQFVAWDADTGETLAAVDAPEFPGLFWTSSDLALFAGQSGDTMVVLDDDGNSIDEVPLVGGSSSEVTIAAIGPSDPPSIAWVELIEDENGVDIGVVIRNPQNDAPLEFSNPFVSGVTSLAFSPDGSLVVAGEADGGIWLFDVASRAGGRQDGAVPGHSAGRARLRSGGFQRALHLRHQHTRTVKSCCGRSSRTAGCSRTNCSATTR